MSNPVYPEGLRASLALGLRMFAALIDAGVSLVRTLDILTQQEMSLRLREVWTALDDSVENGNPLSKAMQAHTDVFTADEVALVRAGELGGCLEFALRAIDLNILDGGAHCARRLFLLRLGAAAMNGRDLDEAIVAAAEDLPAQFGGMAAEMAASTDEDRISEVIRKWEDLFSPVVAHLALIGEESGELGMMLVTAATI